MTFVEKLDTILSAYRLNNNVTAKLEAIGEIKEALLDAMPTDIPNIEEKWGLNAGGTISLQLDPNRPETIGRALELNSDMARSNTRDQIMDNLGLLTTTEP